MKQSFSYSGAPLVTYIEFLILTSLLIAENHGLGLIKCIFDRTGGETLLSPGTLYAALKRMLRARWIKESSQVFVAIDGNQERRRHYELTSEGLEMIIKERNRAHDLVKRTDDILKEVIYRTPERYNHFSRSPK